MAETSALCTLCGEEAKIRLSPLLTQSGQSRARELNGNDENRLRYVQSRELGAPRWYEEIGIQR